MSYLENLGRVSFMVSVEEGVLGPTAGRLFGSVYSHIQGLTSHLEKLGQRWPFP